MVQKLVFPKEKHGFRFKKIKKIKRFIGLGLPAFSNPQRLSQASLLALADWPGLLLSLASSQLTAWPPLAAGLQGFKKAGRPRPINLLFF